MNEKKDLTENKILFSLKEKDKKINWISIENEIREFIVDYYNGDSAEIYAKYSEPSIAVHPNNFDFILKNLNEKFELWFENNNLDVLNGRLCELNRMHIPAILTRFSWKNIMIERGLKFKYICNKYCSA